jgi:hypothetical protein|tara:strand:+ start:1025 stop:1243 length:219 start_codon:yes stop_codon:yes gene_type:complete
MFTLGVARLNAAVGVRGRPEFGFESKALASGGKITEEERRKTSVERHMEAHSAATAPLKFIRFILLSQVSIF